LKIVPVPAGSGKDLDPAVGLRDLAVQLQVAYRADPSNAVLARELRTTLLVLMPSKNADMDAQWKLLMGELSRPVQSRDWFDDGA
jgi:hypothetical protein